MFWFKNAQQKQAVRLENSKRDLRAQTIINLQSTIDDVESVKECYEMMRSYKNRNFDNLFNLCLISSIASSDMIQLTHQIALTNERLEKLLAARMLAMISIEFLNDLNDLLGNKLIKEVESNGHGDFVPPLRDIQARFNRLRKEHVTSLTRIRNNIAAHKTKDALSLVNQIYQLDPVQISDMASQIIVINNDFSRESTKIINQILDDMRNKANPAWVQRVKAQIKNE